MGGSDCEVLGGGWLAQPTNAWSSLAFAVAALVVSVRAGRTGARPARGVPLRLHRWGGTAASGLVAVGSFAYHGPQPSWAGGVHDGSIAMLLAVVVAALVSWIWRSSAQADRGDAVLLAVAAAAVVLGGVAWALGHTDGPLCAPSSWFQWHAVWHVLAAVAAASALLATAGAPGRQVALGRRRMRASPAASEREQPA